MAVSYKKLWKLLIDKEMMKKDLRAMTGVSTTTMSRLSKDENVSTEILSKICSALNCDVDVYKRQALSCIRNGC